MEIVRTGIIGAGVSGLSLALLLDGDTSVFERSDRPGGHASSTVRDGWTFDNGPHIMFSKNSEILEFMIAILGGNVHRSRRNSRVCIDGRFVKYPIENDLAALPHELRNSCLLDYLFNPHAELAEHPRNMHDWFLGVFGEALTQLYLRPYNEKIWKVPLDTLSMTWSERIPRPPAEDVVKGALGISTEGYLHQLYFYYPRSGGYEAIPRALAGLLAPNTLRLSSPIISIKPTQRGKIRLETLNEQHEFDRVVSTVPLPDLIDLLQCDVPQEVHESATRLRINPMAVVTLGFSGTDEHEFSSVYFPDPEFLVHRISAPCTFSPMNGPVGSYSIQAEITAPAGDFSMLERPDSELIDHCLQGIRRHGIVMPDHPLVFSDVQRFQYAYVVYTEGYAKELERVREWARDLGIHLHGRFGAFEYLNVDGCIMRSLELASILNRRNVSLDEIELTGSDTDV